LDDEDEVLEEDELVEVVEVDEEVVEEAVLEGLLFELAASDAGESALFEPPQALKPTLNSNAASEAWTIRRDSTPRSSISASLLVARGILPRDCSSFMHALCHDDKCLFYKILSIIGTALGGARSRTLSAGADALI